MKIEHFFQTHPVFRRDELVRFLEKRGGSTNPSSVNSLLTYHRNQGRVIRIRRKLYASVPPELDEETFQPDRYLVGAHLWEDGVLAFHTALELYGYAHSSMETVFVLCSSPRRDFEYRDNEFRTVLQPKALRERHAEQIGVEQVVRRDERIPTTAVERTLVDCVARPELAGGWEELLRSIDGIPHVNFDEIEEYVAVLDNAATASKVGFILEVKQDDWFVSDHVLDQFESLALSNPYYIDRDEPSTFVSKWNLMVPDKILERSWEDT